jgi:hypothetical protein
LIEYPSQREDIYGVNITKDDAGIVVTFPYNPQLVAKVKTIPGRKWHPEKKFWSFPNTDGTLERLLKAFEIKGVINDNICQVKGFLAIQPETSLYESKRRIRQCRL